MKILYSKDTKNNKSITEQYENGYLENKKIQEKNNLLIQQAIKKKDWHKAYDLYINIANIDNMKSNIIYDNLILLLNNIELIEVNNDNLEKIKILFTNLCTYFKYTPEMAIIFDKIIALIEKNKFIYHNALFGYAQDVCNMIDKKRNTQYNISKLVNLLYEIFYYNQAKEYESKQIILVLSQIINKHKSQNNNHVRILYACILDSLCLKQEAVNMANTITDDNQKQSCLKHITKT